MVGKFLLIFAMVLVLLLVLAWLLVIGYSKARLASVTTDYKLPVLNAIDLKTYRDCNPPVRLTSDLSWYTFAIQSWNSTTRTGTIYLDYFEDLGMNQGVAAAMADFSVSSNGLSVTLTNFQYSKIVGTVTSAMDSGPWTISLRSNGVVELSGRHSEPATLTIGCSASGR